ncbi:MAG: hypothetical protein IJ214_11850, partial [Clostridia bacterium]|nr:hypothetical protein [Clostridia bacterium]
TQREAKTPATAPGQHGKAVQAVRFAHSENQRQAEKNEQAHFFGLSLIFFCPEALIAISKLQAQIVCCFF